MSRRSQAHPIGYVACTAPDTLTLPPDAWERLMAESRVKQGATISIHRRWANGAWVRDKARIDDPAAPHFRAPQPGDRWKVYFLLVQSGHALIACPILKL